MTDARNESCSTLNRSSSMSAAGSLSCPISAFRTLPGCLRRTRIVEPLWLCAAVLGFVLGAGILSGELKADEPGSGSITKSSEPVSRILFGSCIKQSQPAPIFGSILKHQPEVFIFLGDNIYADTEDMQVMQAKYNRLRSIEGFEELMKSSSVLATWDDHDYGANDAGADYPKRREAEKLFLDFWKVPQDSARRSRPGIYDSQVFGPEGQRVQVLLLDTRYFRGPLKKGERRTGGPYYPSDDTSATMLGDAQWKWLEEQLRQPADIRILATSIQCIAESDGQETWSNLPHERQRLLDLLVKTKANGVILISGDRHWSELSRLDTKLGYPLFELTSSSLNQPHPRGTPTTNRYRADPRTYHHENFGSIEIDWDNRRVPITLRIHDADGETQITKIVRLSQMQPDVE